MSNITVTHPVKAGNDLSASSGKVVQYSSGVLLATNPVIGAQDIVGVIVQGGGNTAGEPCVVALFGVVPALAGAILTAGTHRFLTFDATSRVVPAAPGDLIIGEWIGQQAGNAAVGDLVDILVNKSLIN